MEFLSWDIRLTSSIYAFQPTGSCGNWLHLRLLECSSFSCQMDSPKSTQHSQVQSTSTGCVLTSSRVGNDVIRVM